MELWTRFPLAALKQMKLLGSNRESFLIEKQLAKDTGCSRHKFLVLKQEEGNSRTPFTSACTDYSMCSKGSGQVVPALMGAWAGVQHLLGCLWKTAMGLRESKEIQCP